MRWSDAVYNVHGHPLGQLDLILLCQLEMAVNQFKLQLSFWPLLLKPIMKISSKWLWITGPLCGESTGDQWIPHTKGQ